MRWGIMCIPNGRYRFLECCGGLNLCATSEKPTADVEHDWANRFNVPLIAVSTRSCTLSEQFCKFDSVLRILNKHFHTYFARSIDPRLNFQARELILRAMTKLSML